MKNKVYQKYVHYLRFTQFHIYLLPIHMLNFHKTQEYIKHF